MAKNTFDMKFDIKPTDNSYVYVYKMKMGNRIIGSGELTFTQKWISVKDRFPEDGKYLTWNGEDYQVDIYGKMQLGSNKKQFLNDYLEHSHFSVSHWMPLPDPPESED